MNTDLQSPAAADASAILHLSTQHAANPTPGAFLGSVRSTRFYSLPSRGTPTFAAFLPLPSRPGLSVPTVGTPSPFIELAAKEVRAALPPGVERLARYIEVIDTASGRALVVKDVDGLKGAMGRARVLERSSEPGRH